MADTHVFSALEYKRSQIEAAITEYEDRLDRARADLEHVVAAMELFAPDGKRLMEPYRNLPRLFGPREAVNLCKDALAKGGPLPTRELATRVMLIKGMDVGDIELLTAMTRRLAQALYAQSRRKSLKAIKRPGRAQLWALP
ncbi:MAG TPA: hypothetical protein VHX61_07690 [Rhizomicrobium sp.]|jgi:hypothetical protein|nr:hypothetical protein [Rhizomicrobium sp.]